MGEYEAQEWLELEVCTRLTQENDKKYEIS